MPTAAAATDAAIEYRDLSSIEECGHVIALEREIWGPDYDEAMPVGLLKAALRRGAILIGAFDAAGRAIGFVFSLSGLKNGRPVQWSHKLGVLPPFRHAGIGYALKRLQRERALLMGHDLIEWTFDPLQATNAHLNVAKLGVELHEYEEDFYGRSTVARRHREHPTDRFVAAWHIRSPRVQQRLAESCLPADAWTASRSAADRADAVPANRAVPRGAWLDCVDVALNITAARVVVEIPTGFTDMLNHAPDRALSWRMATRQIFTSYFSRGYHGVDFALDLGSLKGAYLLERRVARPQ